MRRFSIAALAILLLPAALYAQEDSLSAQIRADLMQDPRSANMSEAELDALVAALSNESEESGAAEEYLAQKSAPTFTYDAPPSENASILASPLLIAVLALVAGLLGVILFAIRAKRLRQQPTSL